MIRLIWRCSPLLILASAVFAASANPSTIVLKRAWVEKYKDRATIDGKMFVDHALKSPKTPNPSKPADDGDIHAAGRSAQVGLPMVAEIMNAADDSTALDLVHAREKDHQPADVTGVWRLWFEHPPSGQTQIQNFATIPIPGNTNPDHCFEIHPITKFQSENVGETFHLIPKYQPKDAKEAFTRYENLKLALRAKSDSVTLASSMIGYNYVRFRLRLQGNAKPLAGKDGLQALADIYEVNSPQEDSPLASSVRVIFVDGTKPRDTVQGMASGDELVVLGIPRLNLNAVSSYLNAGGATALNRKLPYEMVIVAVE